MKKNYSHFDTTALAVPRRTPLKGAVALVGLLLASGYGVDALAYSKPAFDARSVQDATKALNLSALTESKDVSLTVPDVAENGAAVGVSFGTNLPGVRQMLLLVDKNPTALVARFVLTDAVDAQFSTRLKMAETSQVYAVAIFADGRALFARKEVKVTLSGCGA
jgi:sulfur-oxidizing protein SoxY